MAILLCREKGKQGAEINADETSTIYQYVYGPPGTVYEWGVSHHGRSKSGVSGYKDVMAIFIGPKQGDINPAKKDKNSKDQFMKTVEWLQKQQISGFDISKLEYGTCIPFEVYTRKFAANGEFEGGDDGAFSFIQTDEHTEKWNVWLVVSGVGAWYDYGVTAAEDCIVKGNGIDKLETIKEKNPDCENAEFELKYKMPDYDYKYTVPSTSTDGTIYAYCAYQSAAGTGQNLTYGNIVDYARFSIVAPVRVTSTEGGETDVSLPGVTATVTSENQFSAETAAGNLVNLTVKPKSDANQTYTFVGAHVNNDWIPASDSRFTQNDDGTYTFNHTVIDGMNSIHLVFAKHPYIIHSPNGGTYKGTNKDTTDKIESADTTFTYTETPTAENSARFAYWEIAGENVKVGAEHTVDVANGMTAGKYDLTVKDKDGKVLATVTDTDILVFIAHYEYPQTVNIYTMVGGKWQLSGEGGSATVKYTDVKNNNSEVTANNGGAASMTIYTEDNTDVTVTAYPNADSEYRIERIVSGTNVILDTVYSYYAVGPREISIYYIAGKRKPVVALVTESGEGSYVLDTNTGEQTAISDKGGVYGNTVSTAFTAFWVGDETTYKYIQWVIDLPFDTDTLLKQNSIISAFPDVNVKQTAELTDTDAVNAQFKGSIYRCADGNTQKQLVINFPTNISGAVEIYSSIILDGIYSPNSTALLHSVTEINAEHPDSNVIDNPSKGFSMNGKGGKDGFNRHENNWYRIEAPAESETSESG